MTSLVAINQAMENAVHAMETTSWEHLKIGLGVGNPFIKQIVKVRGTLSGTYEKSNIVLPLYFRNIDKFSIAKLLFFITYSSIKKLVILHKFFLGQMRISILKSPDFFFSRIMNEIKEKCYYE